MKNFQLALALLACLTAASLASQAPKPDPKAPKYDVATEVTVKGVVEDVKDYECPISGTMGSHVILKTDTGPVEIHIAATKFMKDYSFIIKPGDKITIVGSKVQFDGKDVIIARTLDREDITMTFRDKNGKPLW